MFDWQSWRDKFLANPGYNDATDYGVIVSNIDNPLYDVIGVHHLRPDENRGNHHIFIDVLCKPEQDGGPKRIMNAVVNWTWEDRTQSGLPDPVLIGKPENEIAALPFFSGVKINIWHPAGNGVTGLTAVHPDELGPNGEKWNSIGHHSFLVVFQEIGSGVVIPPPPPPVEDESVLRIKKSWFDSQPLDEDGYVRIY